MTHDATILKLRAAGPRVDDPRVRAAVHRQVATSALAPAALPPSSILIIRSMSDPKPGVIGADPTMTTAPAAWRDAARRKLDDLHHAAYRPAHQMTPDDAAAVLFADEAELIACLLRDVDLGVAGRRWWWRHRRMHVTSDAAPADVIVALLLEEPRRIAHVVVHLCRWRVERRILTRLSRLQAAGALAALCRTWNMPELLPSGVALAEGVLARSGAADPVPPSASMIGAVPLPSPGEALPPEHQAILWLSTWLVRSPQQALARRHLLHAWWSQAVQKESTPSRVETSMPRTPAPVLDETRARPPAQTHAQADAAPTHTRDARETRERGETPATPSTEAVAASHGARDVVREPGEARVVTSTTSHAPMPPPVDLDMPAPPPAVEPRLVGTSLGGVFYLVNVIERLNLLRGEWGVVPAWQALEALGMALALDAGIGVEDDLWAWLAKLSRPNDDVPGRDVRLPSGVLNGSDALNVDLPIPTTPAVDEWIGVVGAHVRGYLREVLQQGEHDAIARLLTRRAEIHETSSHIDVVFPLEAATVDVRMAGLDRDPGWLPAFARVISFQYK